jgi:hypothetical protein
MKFKQFLLTEVFAKDMIKTFKTPEEIFNEISSAPADKGLSVIPSVGGRYRIRVIDTQKAKENSQKMFDLVKKMSLGQPVSPTQQAETEKLGFSVTAVK